MEDKTAQDNCTTAVKRITKKYRALPSKDNLSSVTTTSDHSHDDNNNDYWVPEPRVKLSCSDSVRPLPPRRKTQRSHLGEQASALGKSVFSDIVTVMTEFSTTSDFSAENIHSPLTGVNVEDTVVLPNRSRGLVRDDSMNVLVPDRERHISVGTLATATTEKSSINLDFGDESHIDHSSDSHCSDPTIDESHCVSVLSQPLKPFPKKSKRWNDMSDDVSKLTTLEEISSGQGTSILLPIPDDSSEEPSLPSLRFANKWEREDSNNDLNKIIILEEQVQQLKENNRTLNTRIADLEYENDINLRKSYHVDFLETQVEQLNEQLEEHNTLISENEVMIREKECMERDLAQMRCILAQYRSTEEFYWMETQKIKREKEQVLENSANKPMPKRLGSLVDIVKGFVKNEGKEQLIQDFDHNRHSSLPGNFFSSFHKNKKGEDASGTCERTCASSTLRTDSMDESVSSDHKDAAEKKHGWRRRIFLPFFKPDNDDHEIQHDHSMNYSENSNVGLRKVMYISLGKKLSKPID